MQVMFFVVYRQSNYDQAAMIMSQHWSSSNNYVNIVVGDINCLKIKWMNSTAPSDYVNQ